MGEQCEPRFGFALEAALPGSGLPSSIAACATQFRIDCAEQQYSHVLILSVQRSVASSKI
jgi:hypothetical protein